MKPGLIALLLVTALAGIGLLVFVLSAEDDSINIDNNSSQLSMPVTPTEEISMQTDAEQAEPITPQEVAQHASANDCWTIIDGTVYDITQYVPRHPGGNEILQACGTDGSSLFKTRKTQEGESVGSGTPHSSNASQQLEAFKIGVVNSSAE
jgi:cytochrome b involved in lipid metabolism